MRKLILTLMLAIAGIVSASAETYFDAFHNEQDVEVVQISKTMLGMANSMGLGVSPIGSISDMNLGDKLDYIEVLTVDSNKAQVKKLSKALDAMFTQKKGFETIVYRSENDGGDEESTKILFRENKKKNSNQFVVININCNGEDMDVVVLSGSFSLADLNMKLN